MIYLLYFLHFTFPPFWEVGLKSCFFLVCIFCTLCTFFSSFYLGSVISFILALQLMEGASTFFPLPSLYFHFPLVDLACPAPPIFSCTLFLPHLLFLPSLFGDCIAISLFDA